MKAKLIKKGDEYILNPSIVGYKLSKQNCDEIFGVVDVENLANNSFDKKFNKDSEQLGLYDVGFIDGFNKAMELNQRKLFTLEDMINFAEYCKGDLMKTKDLFNEYQSIQQPTEINVEIVTESMNIDEIREQGKGFLNANLNKPKLDDKGRLILKRK
jgi:hypothetical protein